MTLEFAFDNSYARLPDRCHARLAPTPVRAPRLLQLNAPLARQLGLDPKALAAPEGLAVLAGNRVPAGAEPLAMAYAGHQFGGFVPQLGDGRAILLGELLTPDGERFDLQLKGAGRTPFSRAGDGRAWLGPVLREYLIGEAMQALGIPTTRALAAVATGETVWREEALPGAVLTRVARSHLRIGTFEYFAARQDLDALRQLADHALARHDPAARQAERPALALLESVIDRQAELVARWLGVGFIHGVMNTDNTSISGETLDYGPCAFMDHYRPDAVYSSIDRHGRYAYGNQPRIAHWNLASLAQALLPLLDPDPERARDLAQAAVDRFPARFEQAWLRVFGAKLGLRAPRPEDAGLIEEFLDGLAASGADFTNSFRALCDHAAGLDAAVGSGVHGASGIGAADSFGLGGEGGLLAAWLPRWRARLAAEPDDPAARAARMRLVNPALVPRNHQVERVLAAAVAGDLEPFRDLLAVLADPWSERPAITPWRAPPRPHEEVQQTFCGT